MIYTMSCETGSNSKRKYIKSYLLLVHYVRIHIFESRVALNPGLGGIRDVASVIIFHEQTLLFSIWMLYSKGYRFQINSDLVLLHDKHSLSRGAT